MRLSDRFDQALVYAVACHSGQLRKGTETPYISHLLMVAAIALEHGATEDEAIAALLHDAAEDAGGRARLDDIRARFGEAVAAIVDGCTDTYDMPKPAWRPRKERYVAHVREEANRSVRLVSACDKIANARAILNDYLDVGDRVWERFKADRESVLWYYRAVTLALASRGSTRATRELERTVSALEAAVGKT